PASDHGDAQVSAGARLGLRMTFKIDGAINPWAEFAVLDGAFSLPDTPPWRGAPLTSFVLLPERELFTFEIDFGKPVETQNDAKLPTESKPAKANSSRKEIEGKQEPGGPKVDDRPPEREVGSTTKAKAGSEKEEQGFSLTKLVEGIVGDSKFKPIWEAIKAVADTIEAIIGF